MNHDPSDPKPSDSRSVPTDADRAEWNRLKNIANFRLEMSLGKRFRLDSPGGIAHLRNRIISRWIRNCFCHPLHMELPVLCCILSRNHDRVLLCYGKEAVEYLRQWPGVARCMLDDGFVLPPGFELPPELRPARKKRLTKPRNGTPPHVPCKIIDFRTGQPCPLPTTTRRSNASASKSGVQRA